MAWVLIFLLVLPFLGYQYLKKRQSYYADMGMSTLEGVGEDRSLKSALRPYLPLLKLLGMAFFIVALARPQTVLQKENINVDGIDIMIAMDISPSMLAMDFEPNRLESSKEMAAKFVDQREYDRIGLVIFSGESFTQCPLTTDHSILKYFLNRIKCGWLNNGTHIGTGLINAVNRLKDSEAKSRIVILLTDGSNNGGYTSPEQAIKAAKQLGIKVYTIGVGSKGQARMPVDQLLDGSFVYQWRQVDIDEDLLKKIAAETGGLYFRAVNEETLEAVYEEIGRLETTKIETTTIRRYREEFFWFLIIGLGLVLIEVILSYTVFRTIVQ